MSKFEQLQTVRGIVAVLAIIAGIVLGAKLGFTCGNPRDREPE